MRAPVQPGARRGGGSALVPKKQKEVKRNNTMSVLFKCDNCRHHLKGRHDPINMGWFPAGGAIQTQVFYNKTNYQVAHFCDKHCVEMFFLNKEEEFIWDVDERVYRPKGIEVVW